MIMKTVYQNEPFIRSLGHLFLLTKYPTRSNMIILILLLLLQNRASFPKYDACELLGHHGWNWTTMLDSMTKSKIFTGINCTDYDNFYSPVPITHYQAARLPR